MSLKISYNNPAYPKGEELDLTGVGIIKNGSTVTLDEDAELAFVSRTGQSVKDYFKGSEVVKIEGQSEVKTSEVTSGGES